MRVLLDECIDQRFAKEIIGHEVVTVPQAGWAGMKNGELLRRAAGRFDAFVTVDRNLAFQQDISSLKIAVFVLVAATNRLTDLKPLISRLLAALTAARSGDVVRIS